MTSFVWTHPTHRLVAVIATLLNLFAVGLSVGAIWAEPWFTGEDSRRKITREYYLLNMDVDCSNEVCVLAQSGLSTMWQKVALNMIFAGVINNIVTLALLLLVFWPVALCWGRVINPILIAVRTLGFIGAYFKYAGVFIFIAHMTGISRSHAKLMIKGALKLNSLPLALLLSSFLAEIIVFMFLLVATDVRPRTGGHTHRQRLGLDEVVVVDKDNPELLMTNRKVSYFPDQRESHLRLLTNVSSQESNQHNTKKEVKSTGV